MSKSTCFLHTASAGENGSVSPSGAVEVEDGDDKAFTITPDEGYEIAGIKVDGADADIVDGGYTFTNVTSNHTIEVTFKKQIRSISSVKVTIPAPEVGQAFANKGTVAATGLTTASKTPNITWTTKDENAVSGNAEFNTTYIASVTLSADKSGAPEFTFASDVNVKLNEGVTSGIQAD